MASNAAPPGLGNAAENAPTPFPHPTSARKHADLSAKIAGADIKIASADDKMESAGAKMASGGAKSASAAVKMESEDAVIAGIGTPPVAFVVAGGITMSHFPPGECDKRTFATISRTLEAA